MTNTPINIPSFEEAARIEQFVNFSKNSYLVNNNALYPKHTEHISTTEPLYLDGMDGSDNIVHEKITLPPKPILVKIETDRGYFFACEVKQSSNGEYEVAVHGGEKIFYLYNSTGNDAGAVMQSDRNRSLIMQVASQKTSQNISSLSIIPGYVAQIENWDAYEKIEMQSQKIAALYYGSGENSLFIIGTLRGEDFEIITNGGYGCTVNINGVLNAYDVDPEYEGDYILGVLQGFGITATSLSEKEVSWEVGSTVPNWSEYTQYK